MSAEAWNRDLAALANPPPLLQGWGFGQVQSGEGWAVERVRLAGGARATLLVQGAGPLRAGYVPRGPVPASAEAVAELAAWARERGLASLRVEPEGPPELGEALRRLGFRPAPAMHPVHTSVVELGPEDRMLASFRPKHRYNVRLAERRGVVVEIGEDAQELVRQHLETARRQRIGPPALAHYRRRLELLEWCRIYVARLGGEPLAAIMVARFEGRAYYLFGGSSGSHRELMPTYAVQWAAMREAAADGCRDYDLWGMPPDDDPAHPWAGLRQFKQGFGGRPVLLTGAWEITWSPLAASAAGAGARLRRAIGRGVLINKH